MNFYAWIKPPASDIDAFEKLGNPGWNWEDYDKYSKRSERHAYQGIYYNYFTKLMLFEGSMIPKAGVSQVLTVQDAMGHQGLFMLLHRPTRLPSKLLHKKLS